MRDPDRRFFASFMLVLIAVAIAVPVGQVALADPEPQEPGTVPAAPS